MTAGEKRGGLVSIALFIIHTRLAARITDLTHPLLFRQRLFPASPLPSPLPPLQPSGPLCTSSDQLRVVFWWQMD